jgi:hypothetical protein
LGSQLNANFQESSGPPLVKISTRRQIIFSPHSDSANLHRKVFRLKPKKHYLHQSIDIAVANTLSLAIVTATKHLTKEERPDQSDNLSFPSGHTAIAFTNAALLFQE